MSLGNPHACFKNGRKKKVNYVTCYISQEISRINIYMEMLIKQQIRKIMPRAIGIQGTKGTCIAKSQDTGVYLYILNIILVQKVDEAIKIIYIKLRFNKIDE